MRSALSRLSMDDDMMMCFAMEDLCRSSSGMYVYGPKPTTAGCMDRLEPPAGGTAKETGKGE